MPVAEGPASHRAFAALRRAAEIRQLLKPGEHGTTFGGGPLACRLALEFLDVIEEEGLLARVSELGTYLAEGIRKLGANHPTIGEVRGAGLMIGVEIGPTARDVVERLLRRGVIANAAHDTTLRLLPPFRETRRNGTAA